MKSYTGGCLCQKITYRVDGGLRPVMACHCNQCRKTSGHYVAATQTPTANLHIAGDVTWFHASRDARRGFCGTCGGQLFWQPGDRSVTSIFAGSLDGETGLKMETQIHVDTKGDYYELPEVPICEQDPIAG
ncbi:GFA family protein [Leisingera methylohalidivorans]|uniref:GFA family protein n=1 Tax=Leisingera methylohalidivorans TaxID=133924 RepID=UPI000A051BD0|nr:GFA family protein [Leisingera methylohalidivorans]